MILTLFGSLLVDGDNLLFTSPLSLFAIIEHLTLQSITFKIWLFHIETFRDNFHHKKDMEIWLALLTEWTEMPSGLDLQTNTYAIPYNYYDIADSISLLFKL